MTYQWEHRVEGAVCSLPLGAEASWSPGPWSTLAPLSPTCCSEQLGICRFYFQGPGEESEGMSVAGSCYCPQAPLLSHPTLTRASLLPQMCVQYSLTSLSLVRGALRTIFSTLISLCCFLNFFQILVWHVLQWSKISAHSRYLNF